MFALEWVWKFLSIDKQRMKIAKVQIEKLWGAVIGWKDKRLDRWHEKRSCLGKKNQPYDGELSAISDAIEVTIKETRNTNATSVTAFTDSKAAMTKIQKKDAESEGLTVKGLVYEKTEELTKTSIH